MRTLVKGQSTTEYAIFVAVVAAALVAMTVYVRRAIQAHLKLMEKQTSAQPMQAGDQVANGGGGT